MTTIQVTKTFGKTEIKLNIEGKDTKDALLKASIFTESDACGNCKKDNVSIQGRVAKSYPFVDRVCGDCGYQSSLGSYKEGGYFWKEWVAPFKKDDNYSPPSSPLAGTKGAEDHVPSVDVKDLGF